jgi:hypothetical protein
MLFPDVFDGEVPVLAPVAGSMACDFARKVLFAVSEGDVAERAVRAMREKFAIEDREAAAQDDILDFLLETYAKEETVQIEQLREQYDMDARQYGGVATFGQFQTLVQFSARKLDWRMYPGMMRETGAQTKLSRVSFSELMAAMHRYAMLVPFTFERIDFTLDTRPDDVIAFMRRDLEDHLPWLTNLLERLRKDDDSLFKKLNAAKAKFEQALETKRTGGFTEVAQRELYELIRGVVIE